MGFRGRVRSRGLVHVARAYLAGAGTTGSLLAVAALVFIVASALVAFRGWPHVAAATAPGRVVISANRGAPGGTPAARRLALVAGAPGAGGAGGAGAGGAGGAGRGPSAAGRGLGRPGPPRQTIGAPASTSVPVSGSGGSGGTTCASGCGTAPAPSPSPTPVQRVQQTLSQATNTLGNVVSGTGSRLGSTVQQTTSGVAGALGGSSTPVGGTVSQAGSGAAKTVTGVTHALGGVLKSLGH
jgi:hypothetical protein